MDKLSAVIERLKKTKHIELIVGAIAIVLVLSIYFACASCSKSPSAPSTAETDLDYCTAMQNRLERVVSEISGVGNASIVINWDKTVSTAFGGGAENPKATGALIVCEGGNDTKVKLDVMYAVSTLLGLSIENITVYPK